MLSVARRSLATLALLGALTAAPADAGEYSVNVCRHADGSTAPTDGWQPSVADDYATNDVARDSCAIGGQIELTLGSGTAHGAGGGAARVSYAASPPSATSWSRLQAWWAYGASPVTPTESTDLIAGTAGGPQTSCSWGRGTGGCSARGVLAGPPLNPANVTSTTIATQLAGQPLALNVTCDSSPAVCPAGASAEPYAQLRAWRLVVTLTDASAPAFSAQPALPSRLAGPSVAIRVSATDAGSGVQTARAVVDGTPTGQPVVVDAAGGRCRQQPDGSFDHLVPCPGQVTDVAVVLDIGSVPDGPHQVAVRLADAAGNTVDSGPATVTVSNPPPPVPLAAIPLANPLRGRGHVHNGSGSASTGAVTAGLRRSARASLRRKARVLPGKRVRLGGRLVAGDGKPVAGALLVVRSTRAGRAPRLALVRTRGNGTFTTTLAWGPTRRLAIHWYPWGDSSAPVASRSLRFIGAARISLRVAPRTPRNGRALRFTGTAFAAPKGARVTIQVRSAGFWRTFLTPAVDARGHYAGKRLLVQSAGLSYCVRARILSQRGFAYSAGFSRTICRRVRRS